MSTTEPSQICPCGSGQTLASCCLGTDLSPALRIEAQFCERLRQFALSTRGIGWFHEAKRELQLERDDQELFESWYAKLVYFHYGRPTIFESFLAQRPALSLAEKSLIWSLRQVRLSIFSIEEIRRGDSILMEDLIFGGQAWVAESTLAEPDMLKAVLLGRLAPVGNQVFLMGMYIRPMADWKARQIATEMRNAGSSPEMLRTPGPAMALTQRFRQGLQELDDFSMPLQVTAEGEQRCRVLDFYPFAPEARAEIRAHLGRFPELYWDGPNTASWIVGTSELGQLELTEDAVRLECDSLGRADRLGEALGRVTALSQPRRIKQPGKADAEVRSGYQEWARLWPDQPLAQLGGRTPRQAAASSGGERAKVESMLRDFECYQASLPETQSIALADLRQQLELS